jgi:diguanylate cyclase (GGDEF)-like protein
MDTADRPASRILVRTAYLAAAGLVLAVPALFYLLHAGDAPEQRLETTVRALGIMGLACASALLAIHLGPLRRMRAIEDELRFRAEHDLLTGLLNRASLRARIAEARSRAGRAGTSAAVMFVDLDDFKMVNDTMGHAAGDALLRDVAARLRESVRLGDTVARLGGDEFALVFETITPETAAAIAAKLVQRVRQPYTVAGRRHDLSCSIGIAMHPADDGDADQLLAYGNIAMQECKRRGKSDYAFYSRSMQEGLEERRRMQVLVREAWEERAFEVHYQPVCDAGMGRLTAAEALIRWRSDDLGDVPPHRFVTTLEEIGLIGEVGDWVLREACRQARAWSDAGFPPFVVSVNVSPLQFRAGEALVASVREALAEVELHPSRLQIELTEGAMMENRGESLLTMNQLKALGVAIAVDDFGTGYSSLSYLKHFPVDALKIDRVFVSELSEGTGDSNIVVAIVQLARGLNLAVIAEGVETEEQLALLRGYGCDSVQGYVFAPALSPERFERGVLRNTAWMSERTQRLQVPVFAPAGVDDELADRTLPARSLRGRTPRAENDRVN